MDGFDVVFIFGAESSLRDEWTPPQFAISGRVLLFTNYLPPHGKDGKGLLRIPYVSHRQPP
jgi:hypothetical protein